MPGTLEATMLRGPNACCATTSSARCSGQAIRPCCTWFAETCSASGPAPVEQVWELTAVRRILARQKPDGRWAHPGGDHNIRSAASYDQLETYRQLGTLVHKFALDRRHPAVGAVAEFLNSLQTEVGDYRGIYGSQYTPNYSAAMVLVTAGYGRSRHVRRSMQWLMSMRQDDGGWAVPTRTLDLPLKVMVTSAQTFEPNRTRPSSHLITGIVLRALTAHPEYRFAEATHRAGDLLKDRLFTRDTDPDHAARSFWLQFSYPFWWTDLLSALDSLSRAGYRADDPAISQALRWFVDNQQPEGRWNVGRNRPKGPYSDLRVAFAVCRMLRRALDGDALTFTRGTTAPSSSQRPSVGDLWPTDARTLRVRSSTQRRDERDG